MVFRTGKELTYKLRLARAPRPVLSTGCVTKRDGEAVEFIVDGWLGRRGRREARPDVVEALAAKRLTLIDAIEAHMSGRLDELMAALTGNGRAVDLTAPRRDPRSHELPSHVDAWHAAKLTGRRGRKSAGQYRRMLLALYPERPFLLSTFTRAEVFTRLNRLTVDAPTRNRYRSVCSSFAKYLVTVGLLETNFVRDISGFGENPARVVHYRRADAQRLVAAMRPLNAAAAAFACGFCAEWGAVDAATVADFDLTPGAERAYVKGSKTDTRRRWVPLVPENRWVLPYIRAVLTNKLPKARAFEGLETPREATLPENVRAMRTASRHLRYQQRVARELKIVAEGEGEFGQHTFHDWRHTHAVQLLRDGYTEAIGA